jgi:hypothetical protein
VLKCGVLVLIGEQASLESARKELTNSAAHAFASKALGQGGVWAAMLEEDLLPAQDPAHKAQVGRSCESIRE